MEHLSLARRGQYGGQAPTGLRLGLSEKQIPLVWIPKRRSIGAWSSSFRGLSKGGAEALKVGLEEAYIPTHHPEVRDLLAFHPEIDSLRADT